MVSSSVVFDGDAIEPQVFLKWFYEESFYTVLLYAGFAS